MCIICKNDSLKSLLRTEYEYPGDNFFRNCKHMSKKSKDQSFQKHLTPNTIPCLLSMFVLFNTTKEGVCVIGHKSGTIRWCTKVIFHFLSSN